MTDQQIQKLIVGIRPNNIVPKSKATLLNTSQALINLIENESRRKYEICSLLSDLVHIVRDDTLIEFHAELPEILGVTPENLVEVIKELVNNDTIKIAVIIRATTSKELLEKFKLAGIDGIVLHGNSWSYQHRASSIKEMCVNGSYWPAHIINSLPAKTSDVESTIIYFCSDLQTPSQLFNDTIGCHWKMKFCGSWGDLSEVLREEPDQIIFHIDTVLNGGALVSEFIPMIETLIKFTVPDREIGIGVIIEGTTSLQTVKAIKRTSALGIIPSSLSFGKGAFLAGLNTISKNESHWPKNIINNLPGNIVKPKKKIDSEQIKLTERQAEIFNLVSRRGLSNKKIAQVLNISESTVKVHMSAILKAYRVRNRTQLALAGGQGLRA